MKYIRATLIVLLCAYWSSISAQISPEDTTLVKNFRLNFAIPDLPAFKIMGTNPSNILRPSSPKALAAMVSDFGKGGQVILPSSFAAEIAPYILLKSNSLTLREYDNNSELYSLRISIGTQRDPANDITTNLALGARMTLIDDGDLKNDKQYRQQLFDLLDQKVQAKDAYQLEYLKQNNFTAQEVAEKASLEQQQENYVNQQLKRDYDAAIDSLNTAYKEKNWNKKKLDVAVAVLGTSPDSLAKDTKFNKFSVWATYGTPLGQHGQLLLGWNFNYVSGNIEGGDSYTTNSIASRIYGGENKYKGFLELQYERDENLGANMYFANLGGEFLIMDGVWGNISAGLERNWTDNESHFASNFDIKFTIPEKLKLFK
ncbi:hypothetical protein JMN32_08375 [Fulvivirga sp. 29W222]|uniref:Uncharacterized protein n=1 Tax=Fulvivirga marina TaxID=2494733 RepID=A0A937G0M2_9BACT|nr:hypothetical protein [Fulvivirga marina]MBL6446321.1 hypothetical protein [Fulvivirga marina]